MSMSMTVSVRVKHLTSAKAAGQRRHDERVGSIPNYVDRERTKDNSVIQPTMLETEARRQCEMLRSQNEHKRSMRSNAAVITSGVVTFGTKAQSVITSLSIEEQNQIYQDIADRVASELKTRLVGLSVHRDESSPHAHFALLAVNREGNPISKTMNRTTARALQDIAGEVLAEHDLSQITRGKSKLQRIKDHDPVSTIIHRSVRQLHDDLPKELEAAQARLNEIYDRQDDADSLLKEKMDKVRYYEALAEKAKAQAELENANLEKLKKRVSTYENRVNKLLEDIAKLENSDIKEIREALENTGVISSHEVMYAGTEDDDSGSQVVVNHDLDWD